MTEVFAISPLSLYAQHPFETINDSNIDSLKRLITQTKKDTEKIILYEQLGVAYRYEKKLDSCVSSYKQAVELNEKNSYSLQKQCNDIATIDYVLYEMGNYLESLKYASRELNLTERLNDTLQKGYSHLVFGHDYREMGNYRQALDHYFKGKDLIKSYWLSRKENDDDPYILLCISQTYLKMNKLDSASIYTSHAYKLAVQDSSGVLILLATRIYGDIHLAKGNDETALKYYRQYVPDYVKYKETNRDLGFVLNNMARIFQKRNLNDSAVFYAKKALSNATEHQDQQNIYDAATMLYDLYNGKNLNSDFAYFKIAEAAKDSMASIEKIRQIQALTFNEEVREKQQQEADAKQAAKTKRIIIIASIFVSIIAFLIWNRVRQLRVKYKSILEQKESEKLKAQLLELEAKALRAQMNPHFIFNCMNSIKLLMQQNENEKAINYLTTFSKLIRTIFQNSDKREITLYDEIETCKLYTQLESMRFADKFSYAFCIDETIDLKLLMVPALIIQPFIENAIWHGIMPKEDGGCVKVIIKRNGENVLCIIDDDGIGRETSKQNKFKTDAHESKGVHLTQSRIDLDNLINQRNASLEIIDKKDGEGNATGTKVILTFREF